MFSRPGKSLLDSDGDLHYEGGMEILDGTCQVNRHGTAEVGYRLHVNRRSRSHETPLSLELNVTTFANQKSQLLRSTEWCMLGDMEILDDFCGVHNSKFEGFECSCSSWFFSWFHISRSSKTTHICLPLESDQTFLVGIFWATFILCAKVRRIIYYHGNGEICEEYTGWVYLYEVFPCRNLAVKRSNTWLFWLTCFNL